MSGVQLFHLLEGTWQFLGTVSYICHIDSNMMGTRDPVREVCTRACGRPATNEDHLQYIQVLLLVTINIITVRKKENRHKRYFYIWMILLIEKLDRPKNIGFGVCWHANQAFFRT